MLPLNQQQVPTQPRGNGPMQVFKIHVDLTEIYGEFFVGLAEKIIAPLVGEGGVVSALDDYQNMGPQIFGDLVRVVFRIGGNGKGATAVIGGQTHWTAGTGPTLFSMRQFFPSETQYDGGPAQQLIEYIHAGICSQVARSEAGAKHSLQARYNMPVDIIYTDYPAPYIHTDGEAAYVVVYGEVYPKQIDRVETLTDEDLDESEEDLAYDPANIYRPPQFTQYEPGQSVLDKPVVEADLSTIQSRF